MSDEMRSQLELLIRKPTGALLVTGPTGSGKSTTLYAALTEINRPEINIITVEDPVEYRLQGVNQVQINQKAGLTFATALRSILRSDRRGDGRRDPRRRDRQDLGRGSPDGSPALDLAHERRAAGTHTAERDGCRAVPCGRCRLRCARPASCAQALLALLRDVHALRRRAAEGTRLARRGCCERRHGLLPQEGLPAVQPDRLQGPDRDLPAPRHERAAREPRRDEGVREEIERAAIGEGMRTLWDDGLAKVAAGLTSIEELARVSI